MNWIILFIGLTVMIFGADWLIRGCVLLARKIGISEFLVSFFIIGIGTSMPELIVSIVSSINNQDGLVIGNTVASNIINILGILGIGAIIYPIKSDTDKRKLDIWFLILANILMIIMAFTNMDITRTEGFILLAIFITYFILQKKQNRTKNTKHFDIDNKKIIIPIIIGLIAIYFGGKYFLDSLNAIIITNHINETIAGLLILAPATSAPELLVTIIAAFGRRGGIALGNIMGSCLANICLVIASSAIIGSLGVSMHILSLDIWVMLFATLLMCWQIIKFRTISRLSGFIYLALLGIYFLLV